MAVVEMFPDPADPNGLDYGRDEPNEDVDDEIITAGSSQP
jgi:hypothetical protein